MFEVHSCDEVFVTMLNCAHDKEFCTVNVFQRSCLHFEASCLEVPVDVPRGDSDPATQTAVSLPQGATCEGASGVIHTECVMCCVAE